MYNIAIPGLGFGVGAGFGGLLTFGLMTGGFFGGFCGSRWADAATARPEIIKLIKNSCLIIFISKSLPLSC